MTGNCADAERALARLVADAQSDKTIGSRSTVSELLEGMVRDRLDGMGADHDA